jgi:hypothetical protein
MVYRAILEKYARVSFSKTIKIGRVQFEVFEKLTSAPYTRTIPSEGRLQFEIFSLKSSRVYHVPKDECNLKSLKNSRVYHTVHRNFTIVYTNSENRDCV